MSPTPSKKRRPHWSPGATGLATTAFVAGLLITAGLDSDSPSVVLKAAPFIALVFGMIMSILHRRRLWSIFWGAGFGLLLGTMSSWSLIGHDVEGVFFTVLATLALFISIGFLVGCFIEFVQFLHFIAHGNKASEYRPLKTEK